MQANTTDKIIVSELNISAWRLRYTDREEAMRIALEAKEKAAGVNDLLNFNYAKLTIAQLGFWKIAEGNHLQEATEALFFFETENELLGLSRAHCLCAGMYDQYGQYEKAMFHAQHAVKISKQADDLENRADCYTMLGQIYSRTHDYSQAIKKLKQGLEIRKLLNDEKAMASSLNLIGRSLVLSKNFIEAESYYLQSLELRKKTGDGAAIPWTYLGLASLFSEKGEQETAIHYYDTAERSHTTKDKRFELLCLIGRGKIYLAQLKIAEAISCLATALEVSEQLKIISLTSEAHQLLSAAYEKETDFSKALYHYKCFNNLQQELLSNEKINLLKHQQIAFSVENLQKEAEIHRLKSIELKNAFDKIAIQHRELAIKNKEITDSIDYAKYIQDAYLPSRDFIKKVVPYAFLLYEPKDIVSGDFYWFHRNEGRLLFAAADCTGHGVPGAIMSVICYNALNDAVKKEAIYQPDKILNHVREVILGAFKQHGSYDTRKDGMDIALVSLSPFPLVDEFTTLQYSGAFNPLWIIRKGQPSGEPGIKDSTDTHYLIEVKADRQPVGAYEKMKLFTLREMKVYKGDTLYSFSDGYADQFGGKSGEKFRSKSLRELLLVIQNESMANQYEILRQKFEEWKNGREQVDDVCVIGVRI